VLWALTAREMRCRDLVVGVVAAACWLFGAAHGTYAGTSLTPSDLLNTSSLPLSTSGDRIVDTEGRTVKLACVNWYGSHMELFVQNVG
jgi:hypothetical protein